MSLWMSNLSFTTRNEVHNLYDRSFCTRVKQMVTEWYTTRDTILDICSSTNLTTEGQFPGVPRSPLPLFLSRLPLCHLDTVLSSVMSHCPLVLPLAPSPHSTWTFLLILTSVSPSVVLIPFPDLLDLSNPGSHRSRLEDYLPSCRRIGP